MKKPANETSEDDIPPPPSSEVPELDEDLRATIREDILNEKTREAISRKIEKANSFINRLARDVSVNGESEDFISVEEATKRVQTYAEKNGLVYIETPLMSQSEFNETGDYSIASAFSMEKRQSAVNSLFQSSPFEIFRPSQATAFQSQSGFVYWKLEHKTAYPPQTIEDEPTLRDDVAETWRMMNAMPKATERAEAVAKTIRQSDKPTEEALSETTVTGEDGSLLLTVTDAGEFSWMTPGFASPQMQQNSPPRPSRVAGAEEAGDRFFKTVFNQLKAGEVGIVPSYDNEKVYVVKVKKRAPANDEELDEMRQNFLSEGFQYSYSAMGNQALREHSGDIVGQLFEKYEVEVFVPEEESVNAQ